MTATPTPDQARQLTAFMATKNGPYSLRGLKSLRGDETPCFEATLLEDGKPVAFVSNDGRGGCNTYYPAKGQSPADLSAALERLNAYAATLPPIDDHYEGEPLTENDETLIFGLVINSDEAKRMKRLARQKTLFVLPGDIVGGHVPKSFRTLSAPPSNEKAVAYLNDKHPDAIVLNEAILEA